MGLISRVSSRTYRLLDMSQPNMNQLNLHGVQHNMMEPNFVSPRETDDNMAPTMMQPENPQMAMIIPNIGSESTKNFHIENTPTAMNPPRNVINNPANPSNKPPGA